MLKIQSQGLLLTTYGYMFMILWSFLTFLWQKLIEEEPMDTSDVTPSSSDTAHIRADSKPADKSTVRSSAVDIPNSR